MSFFTQFPISNEMIEPLEKAVKVIDEQIAKISSYQKLEGLSGEKWRQHLAKKMEDVRKRRPETRVDVGPKAGGGREARGRR